MLAETPTGLAQTITTSPVGTGGTTFTRTIDSLEGIFLCFDINICVPSLLVCLVFSHPQAPIWP